jgi:hypothetical protein
MQWPAGSGLWAENGGVFSAEVTNAMAQAGVDPALIYAYRRAGANRHRAEPFALV